MLWRRTGKNPTRCDLTQNGTPTRLVFRADATLVDQIASAAACRMTCAGLECASECRGRDDREHRRCRCCASVRRNSSKFVVSVERRQMVETSGVSLFHDTDASAFTTARLRLDDDFHVLTKGSQQAHQSIAGKVGKAAVQQSRDLGLGQCLSGWRRRSASGADA